MEDNKFVPQQLRNTFKQQLSGNEEAILKLWIGFISSSSFGLATKKHNIGCDTELILIYVVDFKVKGSRTFRIESEEERKILGVFLWALVLYLSYVFPTVHDILEMPG